MDERVSRTVLVEARGMGKRFPTGLSALEGIDLELMEGEFVSIVGPSGCGKSTLLRLVAGLSERTSGSLSVAGTDPGTALRSTHACGFVFQSPNLLAWRTVLGNVLLPMELDGVGKAERLERARSWIARVGLSEFERSWPAQLSGGMRMRVSIARALANRPGILLMDEPFAALDDITRGRLQEDLLGLRETESFTTLFVTHNVAEAAFLSDRVAVMTARPGRISRVVETDFDGRRDPELRGTPEFAARTREIGRLLAEVAP